MAAAEWLSAIQIAAPCSAEWEQMEGTGAVRFCGACRKSVYNLSAMSADEALATIQRQEGTLCVRLFRRRDGTVIHHDCPLGVRRLTKRFGRVARLLLIFAGVGLSGWMLPNLLRGESPLRRQLGESWAILVDDIWTMLGWHKPLPPMTGEVVMGAMVSPAVPLPVPPPGTGPATSAE